MARSPRPHARQRAAIIGATLAKLGKSAEKRQTKRSHTQAHTRGRWLESKTPSPFDPDERRYGISYSRTSREEW